MRNDSIDDKPRRRLTSYKKSPGVPAVGSKSGLRYSNLL